MNTDDKLEYVKYRIDSAFNAYEAAKVLAENGFWNSAVNRLYYAVFYGVNALLVQNEIHVNSHSGTRSQFSIHYIKTGKLDKKFGKLLTELYDWRQKGDYENIFDYNAESVEPLFSQVIEMINAIDGEIKTKNE